MEYLNEKMALEILEAREERADFIKSLIEKHKKTVVSVRVNYPGINKVNDKTKLIIDVAEKYVEKELNKYIKLKIKKTTAEGPSIILVMEKEPIFIKKVSVKIEEEMELGRLLDIDVYNEKGESLNREQVGVEKRRCFLCNQYAHICSRSKAHSIEEIEKYIENTLNIYLEKTNG